MANIYEKIDTTLKEIRRIQNLIKQGVGKHEEKDMAIQIAKDVTALFTNEILKRKAEGLKAKTVIKNLPKSGNLFASEKEAEQLDVWIELLEEYKETRKIKSELSSEKVNIQSVVDGEDQHIFITEKGSGEHTHLILDGGTGEIRIDPKDKSPHDLIKSVQAKLELKTGETVQITKTALSFIEPETPQPDVKVYTARKDDYNVLEIYNNGDEDLEDFLIKANWTQPEGTQERILSQFNDTTDYLVMSLPKSLNMLKMGTRVYAINIPSISVDKKIKITVSCKGMRSGKKIEKVFELETPNQYQ
ncbi:hypothetical protein A2387_01345 [Candidatus Nomurabacteria bacterium RIFOXYB1_FULL_36_10]|nr:MAG: hypothetical protein A2387_01345 [Candidatus Nomurabacteria bacterium RIFOXYB1_FULL_36_10]